MKNLLLAMFLITAKLSYSQTLTKSKTLKISTEGLTEKNILNLKNELISWNEKVVSVEVGEHVREFTLVHKLSMDETDLFDLLKKYHIKKEDILSYK
ncbi:MAG: hypothetical protein K0R26_1224 [Bacteroidota bacterium]|jgi:hypothetical protein|nr:hypothetical protein [Bacteroidota bacterium]